MEAALAAGTFITETQALLTLSIQQLASTQASDAQVRELHISIVPTASLFSVKEESHF
jgi:hypothetical protein